MTTYQVDQEQLKSLKGKTILITGCASGIGRATAELAHRNGANLILADWSEAPLRDLAEKLNHNSNVIFQKTNVAHWDDLIRVYQLGWEKFGAIDAVISNAGVNSGEVHLQHEIDPMTNLLRAPPLDTLEINLIAHIYMTKCAAYYFGKQAGKKCQIVLTSSAAAFLDTPPLYLYSTAKAGVLGLMRSLRTDLPKSNITINTVAPWFTATPMVPKALTDLWENLPANTPAGIAIALLLPIIQPEINGKTFFVAGNEIVELEDSLAKSQPQWMGEELSRNVDEGQRRLLNADPFE
ncbi:uncharacterized protein A1O5_02204 [Cladophialophora psammophila CBS 110553]|uniref:3-oxoacyl-[acyl-carrier protein] reductase n=1 Tax=Cladophialophora psammophila CBS 110553 TaxID=1182543 RepID=W9X9C2_9EURO|nr:uncharacterized protein A1O5_02204 [Cladophialophora psammophila CBS 110553]EXJ73910.1 hypothetical protein A1O5_02204 [Cladophialophora psammophila CBS 110553]